MPKPFLPSPTRRLRMLAHPRRLGGIMLPFGADIGLAVALALRGLGSVGPWVGRGRGETYPTVVIPAIGLILVTLWLSSTGIGEVSLFKDLDLAHQSPYEVFQFRKSIGKVWACAMTIGFGGSVGVEESGKWFGSALGLQFHRLLRGLSRRVPVAFVGAANESILVPVVFLAETTAQTALVVPALITSGVAYLVSRERT